MEHLWRNFDVTGIFFSGPLSAIFFTDRLSDRRGKFDGKVVCNVFIHYLEFCLLSRKCCVWRVNCNSINFLKMSHYNSNNCDFFDENFLKNLLSFMHDSDDSSTSSGYDSDIFLTSDVVTSGHFNSFSSGRFEGKLINH